MDLHFGCRYLAIKFQEMEEKLRKEKEEEKDEAEKVEKDNQNEVTSESEEQPKAVESSASDDEIHFTPGPVRVPTVEAPADNLISELPPIQQTNVEQERLEMIEIKNVGTSGHLSHSLEQH